MAGGEQSRGRRIAADPRRAALARRFLRQRVGREKRGVFCELDAEVGAALTRRLLARVVSQRQQRSAHLPRSD